ncbi:hypothetical protein [Microvirga rosea]|uniref:hypothetical protein n=1 Tax=Microvirga rosea TaxID=2715425 RepID=UPI001D09D122|nr:hypothetical protein [Microvirga rosea]MCB8821925.1 hypothetical protein [Microvirga rosea]
MMESDTTLLGLISLVREAGGTIETRIRIQKEAYLLALQGARNFRQRSFEYHHYGPFSRELSDTLHLAVTVGLLEEQAMSVSDEAQKFVYQLTDKGKKASDEIGEPLKQFNDFIKKMNSEHWRALELASTVGFLEVEGKAKTREEAVQMALKLKPETTPYVDNALDVLAAMSQSGWVRSSVLQA